MKVIRLLIFASIITYAAARVVSGPQIVDSRKKLQKRQEEDSEGVVVDDVITASNIEVFEVTSAAAIVSSSEISVEVTSAETVSAESETNDVVNEDDADPINRYCKCSSNECNCCREFTLPLVPIQGPGCASIRYLEGDKMSVGIKFGNRVLANRVISGSKDTPVCLPLPGGFSNFCGRVYGISKKGEEFKACLGLELRADEEVEAALRVSCFKFGPRGLKVSEAEPIPALPSKDDDDDDDDIFGFGGDDDEDEDDDILDDDDEDEEDSAAAPASSDDDDDDVDYTGFSLLNGELFDELLGDDEDKPDKVPSRKVLKKKNALKANKVKKPEEVISGASPSLNEIDGPLSSVDLSAETIKPEVVSDEDDDDDDDDDDEEEEESEGGFLSILDDLISDDEDDEDEKETEAEVSEEIEEPELEDETEENDIDDVETSVDVENEKDTQALDDLSDEDEELQEVADDDDDDDDDEIEDELNNDKPSTYSGISLLGFRKFFSRFFQ